MARTSNIDYRDGCWFLSAPCFNCEMGFWTLASALSFATNNLRTEPKFSNAALVQKFKRVA